MKRSFLFLVFIVAALYNYAQTNVSGVISTSVWTKAGSPYNLSAEVIVTGYHSSGVLTIEKGVIINGNNHNIVLKGGSLVAIGDSANKIIFNKTNFSTAYGGLDVGGNYSIDVSFAEINNCHMLDSINDFRTTLDKLKITDSKLNNVQNLWIRNLSECIIERNIFNNCKGLTINNALYHIYVRNNIFSNSLTPFSIRSYNNLDSGLILNNNSFIDTSKIAVMLGNNEAKAIATNNFWKTQDIETIQRLIYDKNDNFNITDSISVYPFLNDHHPNTPIISLFDINTLTGIANTTAFNFTNLSEGYGITQYHWDFGDGFTSELKSPPSHVYTIPGIYAVSLLIKSNKYTDILKKVITVNTFSVDAGADQSIICGGNTQLDPVCNYSGDDLVFFWFPSEGLSSNNIAQPTVEITSDKTYILTVSMANGLIATDSLKVTVIPLTVNAGTDKTMNCGETIQLDYPITNYNGSGALSYSWSPEVGLDKTTVAQPNTKATVTTKYSLKITTPNGCIATDTVKVSPYLISFNPSICMATVNEDNKNIVYWLKENNTAIDSFYLFRESSLQTNKYDLIDKFPYNTFSEFMDSTADARIHSSKYKILIKDVCGFFTDKSSEHKTIHLIGNNGNLVWDPYIGSPVSYYNIYRGTTKSNLIQIGTVSGSNNSYTDVTTPNKDVYYQIEAVLSQACSTSYAGSRSNIISPITLGEINTMSITKQFIYPNPASDELIIKNTSSINPPLVICDLQGKQVLNNINSSCKIDISQLKRGIYIVKIVDSGRVLVNKLVKE